MMLARDTAVVGELSPWAAGWGRTSAEQGVEGVCACVLSGLGGARIARQGVLSLGSQWFLIMIWRWTVVPQQDKDMDSGSCEK